MKTLILVVFFVLSSTGHASKKSGIAKSPFGRTTDGREVYLYTLSNKNGMEVALTNYGGAIVSMKVPDRTGRFADVVLGYDQLAGYESKENPYFGAIVGRYANRIGKGRFTLDGKQYQLPLNNGPNSLHGGIAGFNKRVWESADRSDSTGQHLTLRYLSKDGEEGYPGDLAVTVVYTLTDDNELRIEYSATTDKDTVLNLTNHSYFNLAGQGEGDILGHQMMLAANSFTPVDETLIPTGELRNVSGTPFDFRQPMAIGARINPPAEQLKFGRGYDHNFVLRDNRGKLAIAARVLEPKSGRVMEVLTDQPGIQFYSGNFLDGTIRGKGGKVYGHRYGFCLETQHFPDSPNHLEFPSTELKPGQTFRSTTVYRFATTPLLKQGVTP
jgi:aldose 1-epimerase